MSTTLDIGSEHERAGVSRVALALQGPTTIRHVAGPPLAHFTSANESVPAHSSTANSSVTHGGGLVHLHPSGRTTITITGVGY